MSAAQTKLKGFRFSTNSAYTRMFCGGMSDALFTKTFSRYTVGLREGVIINSVANSQLAAVGWSLR